MKKTLAACALFVACQASAQETNEVKEKVPGLKSFVAVKWNPESLAFGKIGVFGEYNYKKKKSITVGIGIPAEKVHTFKLDDKDQSITMKTSSAMLGYRMYLGKKTMTGFYFEPYLKYMKNEGSTIFTDVEVDPSTHAKTNFLMTSKYSGFGGGAQLGAQFMLFKRLVFDMFILGPEANSAKHNVILKDLGNSIPWAMVEDDAKKKMQDAVGDLPIIGKKIKIETNANDRTATSTYKGFLPGFRGGVSVGIRF